MTEALLNIAQSSNRIRNCQITYTRWDEQGTPMIQGARGNKIIYNIRMKEKKRSLLLHIK